MVAVDSHTRVAEPDDDRLINRLSRDFQSSSIWHGISRVENQIHKDLLQFGRVAGRKREFLSVISYYLDLSIPKLRFEELNRIVNHSVQVDHGESRIADARKV